MLPWLSRDSVAFPPLDSALRAPDGLLAAGGDLSPARLIAAYRHGCFPWFSQGQPIFWWSPDPRMVLFPENLHVSRSLEKVLRKNLYEIVFDQDFPAVIHACAAPRDYAHGTWITERMQEAYIALHELGYAHSVEAYHEGELVGGLYGLAMGRLFFGESMFSRRDNASKAAFVTLVRQLESWGFVMIDCQMHTGHLERFGAALIERARFARYLHDNIDRETRATWRQPSRPD